MADSFSMTLEGPTVEIDLEHADALTVKSFNPDGTERVLKDRDILRFDTHLQLIKEYLQKLEAPDAIPASVSVTVRSHIPSAVGLASSSAVFSCIARAYQGLIQPVIELNDEQTSVIARLGSGSAARSIFSGFSILAAGDGENIDCAVGRQIADESHWELHDIILVPSQEEKKVGSTEGHPTAHTSPHYSARIDAINNHRQQECIDAVLQKDFEKLQKVAEEDCIDMHNVMKTSSPSLDYLTEDTHRITRGIIELRDAEHLPVFYTMDAGPTVQLICTEEAVDRVKEFAHAQEGCTVFESKIGPGARLIS